LQVTFDSQVLATTNISRSQKSVGPVFSSNFITAGPDGRRQHKGFRNLPAQEPRGEVRMVRIGPTLSYLAAEGGGGFQLMATHDVGNDDVAAVRALCLTGWERAPLDARLISLGVRADKIQGQAPDSEVGAAAPRAGLGGGRRRRGRGCMRSSLPVAASHTRTASSPPQAMNVLLRLQSRDMGKPRRANGRRGTGDYPVQQGNRRPQRRPRGTRLG
jgi:hypothetical protein